MTNEQAHALALEIAKKYGKEMAKELLTAVVLPIIDAKVLESGTKIDDIVWASAKDTAIKAIEAI